MKPTEEKLKAAKDAAYKKAGGNAYFGNGFEAGVRFMLRKGTYLWAVHESMERDVRRINDGQPLYLIKGVPFLDDDYLWQLTPEDLNATDWEVVV